MLLLHFDMFYMIFLNQIIEKILKNHLDTIQVILVTQYCMQKLWKKSCLYDSYLFIIANIYDDKYLSKWDWDSLMKQYFNNISNSGLSPIFFFFWIKKWFDACVQSAIMWSVPQWQHQHHSLDIFSRQLATIKTNYGSLQI